MGVLGSVGVGAGVVEVLGAVCGVADVGELGVRWRGREVADGVGAGPGGVARAADCWRVGGVGEVSGWEAGVGVGAGVPVPGAMGARCTTGMAGAVGAVRTVWDGVSEGLGGRPGAGAGAPRAAGAGCIMGMPRAAGAVRTVREGLGVRVGVGADTGFCRATAGTAAARRDAGPAVPAGPVVLSGLAVLVAARRGMAEGACTLERCTAAGPAAAAP
ncbi:hypothetical protein CP981_06195 [Streptomyces platensis]|uniref:Uncharacterized protein n=1 Tax=Streptomyces platensis TaxID=58346 RepID=A0AAE6NEQ8_STRPT|nr:hypothetical protein CP981_06195 [Streptomyces platensis]